MIEQKRPHAAQIQQEVYMFNEHLPFGSHKKKFIHNLDSFISRMFRIDLIFLDDLVKNLIMLMSITSYFAKLTKSIESLNKHFQ